MDVLFTKKIDISSFNVVVITTCGDCSYYIEEQLKPLFCNGVIPNEIISELKKMNFGDVKSFYTIVNDSSRQIIVAKSEIKEKLIRANIEKLGGYIFSKIKSKDEEINVCILNNIDSCLSESATVYIASGIMLKSWIFDKYKTINNKKLKIKSIQCLTKTVENDRNAFDTLTHVDNGTLLTRTLVSEPANVMTPDQLMKEAQNLEKYGVNIKVLNMNQMEKLGMNALLGVSKGSDNNAYTVIMEYQKNKDKDLIALVGKGLTFDSGGLCLKPAKGMGDMKGDMAGAATVIGSIASIASQGLDVNVVGAIGIVENAISGKAQHPGDIVKSMSGKTIEVDNTDAEGRLVLADVLWYVKENYSPKIVIDFATLTGAIQVALGHEFAGLFCNSNELCNKLLSSSQYVGEKLWRMPLNEAYDNDIKSDIADIKNVGSGRGAGSSTAAAFLQHFVDSNALWAHIDIAAVEWDTKDRALSQKGATGFGVRLIDDFVKQYYFPVHRKEIYYDNIN